MRTVGIVLLTGMLALAGCAKKVTTDSTAASGESAKAGSSLAYEHKVSLSIPEFELRQRMNDVRDACADERFGACNLLRFEEASGSYPSGLVEIRIVPAGVESMVELASSSGRVAARQTRAEDLAEIVADTARQKEQLELQRGHLLAFQGRKDLAVADMISLAHELASIESQLSELDRASEGFHRRIETNLLTLAFTSDRNSSRWSELGDSFSGSLDSLIDGTSEMIETVAFGLPFVLVLFPLALVWRWLWRKATSRRVASLNQDPRA